MESETLPSWFKMMEGLLTKQGGNYFAGSQLTWADIAVYSSIDMMKVRGFLQIFLLYPFGVKAKLKLLTSMKVDGVKYYFKRALISDAPIMKNPPI